MSVWPERPSTAAPVIPPSITDAAAADTQLTETYATIVTKTLTVSAPNTVKVTYVAPYYAGAALVGNEAVGKVKLMTNSNGGGDVDQKIYEIERYPVYGFKTFIWVITGLSLVSTVFTIQEKCDHTAGGPLYNASGAGNTANPARMTIEQY